ncbi:MAG TPA: SMP-30/gluconolactonase/LRE family protein [Candidatus Dormibacteraeota bacterium]
MSEVEQLTEPVAFHGEGPVWSPGWGGLKWLDMLAGDILTLLPSGDVERRSVGAVAAAIRPRAAGGAVIATEHGFAIDRGDGAPIDHLPDAFHDRGLRMNEGGCDPDGRFYCGSMAWDKAEGRGSLYRLDTRRNVTEVLAGVTISNGLDWSPDGSLAYYVDSATQQIDVFDYESDPGLLRRRSFVRIPDANGAPDGLTVDADGFVWVALWGGSAIHRYRPDGVLDGVVRMPVSQVTAITFGGPQLDELFITTSREGLPDGAEPSAGALFRHLPHVKGQPVRTYAG